MSQATPAASVRLATLDDLADIARIFLDAFDTALPGVTFSTQPEFSYDNVLAWFHSDLLPNPSHERTTFVAVLPSGETVGFATVKAHSGDFPRDGLPPGLPLPGPALELLFVKVEQVGGGRGAGSALVSHLMRQEVWRASGLWVRCFERNERAIKFYRKWGFVNMATFEEVAFGHLTTRCWLFWDPKGSSS